MQLQSPVRLIAWSRGHVTAAGAAGRWRARAAVIAVPLGVLQAGPGKRGGIRFAPAPASKARLWGRMGVGHARRIAVRLRADAWRSTLIPDELKRGEGRDFGFVEAPGNPFPVWWSLGPEPMLVGWVGGAGAAALAGVPESRVSRLATRSLAAVLGCPEAAASRLVRGARTHDWDADPYTRGAYSFSAAGAEDAPARLAEPLAGTLFFAGEATADSEEIGTVHGAVASGERAANLVVDALGRAGHRV